MEGELFKIGKTFQKFIPRHFVLKDSALLIFKDSSTLTPSGNLLKAYLILFRCYLPKWIVYWASVSQWSKRLQNLSRLRVLQGASLFSSAKWHYRKMDQKYQAACPILWHSKQVLNAPDAGPWKIFLSLSMLVSGNIPRGGWIPRHETYRQKVFVQKRERLSEGWDLDH